MLLQEALTRNWARKACQSSHLAKIQEKRPISKSPLPKEIYTICQNMSLDDFKEVLAETFPVAALMEANTNSPGRGHRWDLILTERNQDEFGGPSLGEYK